jgi:hypothetical protein
VRTTDTGWQRRAGFAVVALLVAALGLSLAAPAHAQSFSTGDLQGTWAFVQLATPAGAFGNASVRSYIGQVTFDGNGVGSPGGDPFNLIDDQSQTYSITSGSLTLGADGQAQGAFAFNGDPDLTDFVVSGARMLTDKHTIVGTATILGQIGLFNLVKLEPSQTFLPDDLAADWHYAELTPINDLARTAPGSEAGDAAWVTGSITFHASGCTDAALALSDTTVRAEVTTDGTNPFG